MKLEDFLSDPSFVKYKDSIGSIKEDFKMIGCEKYLWTKSEEQFSASSFTEDLLSKHIFLENKCVERFIEQFSIINYDKELAFIWC